MKEKKFTFPNDVWIVFELDEKLDGPFLFESQKKAEKFIKDCYKEDMKLYGEAQRFTPPSKYTLTECTKSKNYK